MKKVMNKINFAIIGLMVAMPAFAAGPATNGVCALIKRLHGVFEILRIMAFVGAAFYIAGWAWDYISKGEAKMDDIKKKGIGLLVGFSLLFIIGLVLSFVLSAAGQNAIGCQEELVKW
jgi:hypothetical protein